MRARLLNTLGVRRGVIDLNFPLGNINHKTIVENNLVGNTYT